MLAVVASVVLGCVMCIAGAAKIAMGSRWPVEATALGAPRWVVPYVPWTEVALGALLVAQWQSGIVSLAVGALLAAFTALIVVNLLRGRRPHCACFGTWSARPLGWGHVLRNGGLILLAVIVASMS